MPRRNGTGIALLADETRRQIVAILAERPRRPSDIARELGLSRPATSRQLRLLREAHLIRRIPYRIDRRGALYRLEVDAYRPIVAWLAGTGVSIVGGHSRPVRRPPAGLTMADEPDGRVG